MLGGQALALSNSKAGTSTLFQLLKIVPVDEHSKPFVREALCKSAKALEGNFVNVTVSTSLPWQTALGAFYSKVQCFLLVWLGMMSNCEISGLGTLKHAHM